MSITSGQQMWPDDKAVLFQGLFATSTSNEAPQVSLQIEVKGMRKLAIGDQISLAFMNNQSFFSSLELAVTVFGKLA